MLQVRVYIPCTEVEAEGKAFQQLARDLLHGASKRITTPLHQ